MRTGRSDAQARLGLREARRAHLAADYPNDEADAPWQATKEGGCDQQYLLDLATGATKLVSGGKGRTTCAFFFPDGKRIIYASTPRRR